MICKKTFVSMISIGLLLTIWQYPVFAIFVAMHAVTMTTVGYRAKCSIEKLLPFDRSITYSNLVFLRLIWNFFPLLGWLVLLIWWRQQRMSKKSMFSYRTFLELFFGGIWVPAGSFKSGITRYRILSRLNRSLPPL